MISPTVLMISLHFSIGGRFFKVKGAIQTRLLATVAPSCYTVRQMSRCAEIEAAILSLSAEELARVEATLHRVLRARGFDAVPNGADVRLDGLPWPETPEEAERFEAWRAMFVATSSPS